MSSESNTITENAYWYERLAELVGRLSDADLTQPMEAGWTPASVLGHLAFWDIRIVTLIEKWKAEGEVSPSPIDSDPINEVTRRLLLALPPRQAADLALEWAQAANQAIASLTPEMTAEIREKAPNVRLDRLHHRKAHIEDIEKILSQ
jgi:hypothetical protein